MTGQENSDETNRFDHAKKSESNSTIDKIVVFFNDPNNKEVVKSINLLIRRLAPNPLHKILSDLLIGGLLMLSIIYCANQKYISGCNVESLLALVIGAIVGARFRSA